MKAVNTIVTETRPEDEIKTALLNRVADTVRVSANAIPYVWASSVRPGRFRPYPCGLGLCLLKS